MRQRTLTALAAAALWGGCATRNAPGPMSGSSAYSSWPGRGSDWANLSLNAMVEKYGPPDRLESDSVIWDHRGPWKRLVVFDQLGRTLSGGLADNLEATLAYQVPDGGRQALVDFGRQVMVSADGTELSARAPSEDLAFLTLNLADEVVRGVKTPAGANTFYDMTVRLRASGKSSSYLSGFRGPASTP